MTTYSANLHTAPIMGLGEQIIDGNPQINVTRQIIENPAATRFYLMRGKDIDCVSTTYRVWVVREIPDTDAIFFSGIKCGSSPLSDIVIASTWIIED